MSQTPAISEASLAALKRLRKSSGPQERCELCALPLGERHAHLFEPKARRVLCACDACSFLFQDENAPRYKRVPRDVYHLTGCVIDDLNWEAMSIPVNMAFFFYSSEANRTVAYYPSAAGATESLLNLDDWEQIAASQPRLRQLRPDVEAFLANRLAEPHEYFIVPIDRCYRLSGLLRKHWQGFTGGDEVWREIARFFDELKAEAVVIGAMHA